MSSDLISGQISFAGLGSGTDFSTLIEGLMKIEQRRVTSLESWKQTWENKITAFQELNTKMLSLRTTLQKMDTINEFLAKTASSSNTGVLTATADGDASTSSHTIEVNSLATNDVFITSSGTSAMTSSIATADSDLVFSYAGTSYTLSNISAGTTLEELINRINSDSTTKNRIRASALYDGTTYHLQLTGKDLGGDNQIIISNTGSLIFSPSDFNETQNASNAQLRVNGFPSAAGGYIERSTNTISDIIEGVTLNLQSASPGSQVTVQVATDSEKVKENIRTFVDSVNEVRKLIMDITDIDEEESTDDDTSGNENMPSVKGSILTGNYGVQLIGRDLSSLIAAKPVGFEYYDSDTETGDFYSALSQVGITTDADQNSETYGLLVIEEDSLDPQREEMTLNYAIENYPEELAYLFAANTDGESKSSDITFLGSTLGTATAGSHTVEIITSGAGISSATIDGVDAHISSDGETIYGEGLELRLANFQANTTITGEVVIKDGKVNELIDELDELTEEYIKYPDGTVQGGPLEVLEENYKDIIKSINKKIAYEEERLAIKESRLKDKFSRLDTLLQEYAGKQSTLTTQLAKMSSSS